MNSKEFREEISKKFLEMLESSEDLTWIKGWKASGVPFNGVNKNKYKGINAFILMLTMQKREIKDPRWYTMNQIADVKGYCHKGQKWHLKKGSKGQCVEYWFPYDIINKKMMSWNEYKKALELGRTEEDFTLRARYSYVFSAEDIEGLPAFEEYCNLKVEVSDVVKTLSEKMGVPILNDGGDRAYYTPSEDQIHLPKVESFTSSEAYNMTALHELSHSTGHVSRLNRELKNVFGSEEYAFEELVAELSAVFSSINIDTQISIDNNVAYVKSWANCIKTKPDFLTKAIKAAQEAAEYMDKIITAQ